MLKKAEIFTGQKCGLLRIAYSHAVPEGDLGTQYPIGFCREIQMGRQCWHPPLHPCHNHMDVETIVLWRMRNKCHLEGVEAL